MLPESECESELKDPTEQQEVVAARLAQLWRPHRLQAGAELWAQRSERRRPQLLV